MDKKTKILIRYDHQVTGLSYRTLGEKYGIGHTTIYAMLNPKPKELQKPKKQAEEAALPEDVKTLQAQLREARLMIELQDNMLDIASKELGIDLRKKRGTRQPK
jgi:transposase